MLLLILLFTFILLLYLFPEITDFADKICSQMLSAIFPTSHAFIILEFLELGVAVFCYRLSLKTQKDWLHMHLDDNLRKQAESELNHAKFFNKLSGREILNLDLERFNPSHGTINGVQVDTISTKYLSTKILFAFRPANTYSWDDTLAFMAVLEQFQSCFYQVLLNHYYFSSIKKELEFIFKDEEQHSVSLLAALLWTAGHKRSRILIWKWQIRKYLAFLFVPFDLIWFLMKTKLAFS